MVYSTRFDFNLEVGHNYMAFECALKMYVRSRKILMFTPHPVERNRYRVAIIESALGLFRCFGFNDKNTERTFLIDTH